MISEKTVELNLTTEIVNWVFHLTKIRPYILAPSQRREATLGYDTSIGHPSGRAALIQYKRAHVRNPGVYEFQLNRTKKQDQHLRLQILQLLGFPVYYALPIFHTDNEVIIHRRGLLRITKFVSPLKIMPIGGSIGHHEVKYDSSTDQWTVHSAEGLAFDGATDFDKVYEELMEENNTNNIDRIMGAYNSLFCNRQEITINDRKISTADIDDVYLMESQAIIAI